MGQISHTNNASSYSVRTTLRNVRWSMLLSHHAPCDYDRTWKVGGMRVCVRCLGMFLGAVTGFLGGSYIPLRGFVMPTIMTLALVAPAAIDFSAHELHKRYKSNNARRFLTGVLFGISAGRVIVAAYCGKWIPLLLFVALCALIEITIAILFFRQGHMDTYLARYEEGVWVSPIH